MTVLHEIFNLIKNDLKFDIQILPKILYCCDNFYITEFIQRQEIIKTDEFYYTLGIILAFAYTMRITDLHGDNIVFSGKNVYIVDAETCFYRNTVNENFDLTWTQLLGTRGCAFGNKFRQEFDMQIDKNLNVRYLKKLKLQTATLYLKGNLRLILNGFNDCFKAIVSYKDKIIKTVLDKKINTRHILRPTSVYEIWLTKLFRPSKSFSENVKNIQNEILSFMLGDINLKNKNKIVKYEMNDLIDTDVPFFTVCGRDLLHANKTIVKNFYHENFEDFIKNWFKLLNKELALMIAKSIKRLI